MEYISIILNVYSFLLVANVLMSWIPSLEETKVGRFILKITDPYLNLFKFIPNIGPIGIYPIVAILVYQYATIGLLSLINNMI